MHGSQQLTGSTSIANLPPEVLDQIFRFVDNAPIFNARISPLSTLSIVNSSFKSGAQRAIFDKVRISTLKGLRELLSGLLSERGKHLAVYITKLELNLDMLETNRIPLQQNIFPLLYTIAPHLVSLSIKTRLIRFEAPHSALMRSTNLFPRLNNFSYDSTSIADTQDILLDILHSSPNLAHLQLRSRGAFQPDEAWTTLPPPALQSLQLNSQSAITAIFSQGALQPHTFSTLTKLDIDGIIPEGTENFFLSMPNLSEFIYNQSTVALTPYIALETVLENLPQLKILSYFASETPKPAFFNQLSKMMYLESLSLRTDYGIPPESLQIPNLKRLTIFQILFATTLRNLNSQLGREGILNSVALLSASDLIGCLDGIERGEANFEILRVLPHVGSPKLQEACDRLGVIMQEW